MSAPVILPVYNRDSGSSYGITLRNSQIARPFFINQPSWKRIRVGIMLNFTTGSSTNPAGFPHFTLGFCSGSYLYGDVNCGHFVGVQTNATLIYVSSSTYNFVGYYTQGTRALKKVSGIETVINSDIETSTNYFASENWRNTVPKYSSWFVDLTRPSGAGGSGSLASGSYTMYLTRETTYTNTSQMQWTETTFLSNLVATSGYTFPGNDYSTLTVATPIDEINNGYFDRVYVGWDRENPDPEVKIIAIALVVLE